MEDAWSLVDEDARKWTRQRIAQQLRGSSEPTRFEFKIKTRSGEERWLDFSSNRIEFERRAAIVATAVDITRAQESGTVAVGAVPDCGRDERGGRTG